MPSSLPATSVRASKIPREVNSGCLPIDFQEAPASVDTYFSPSLSCRSAKIALALGSDQSTAPYSQLRPTLAKDCQVLPSRVMPLLPSSSRQAMRELAGSQLIE